MQEKNNQLDNNVATIGKAVEIYVKDGKINIVTALSKNSLLQVISLAMLEVVKEVTNIEDN